MTRKICNGCGGYIGIDCFNPSECEWIAMDEQRIRREREQQKIQDLERRIAELESKPENLINAGNSKRNKQKS